MLSILPNDKLYSYHCRLQLKLIRPMVLEKGQRFTLRDGFTTLGTGVITGMMKSMTEAERQLMIEGRKGLEKKAKKEAATTKS